MGGNNQKKNTRKEKHLGTANARNDSIKRFISVENLRIACCDLHFWPFFSPVQAKKLMSIWMERIKALNSKAHLN